MAHIEEENEEEAWTKHRDSDAPPPSNNFTAEIVVSDKTVKMANSCPEYIDFESGAKRLFVYMLMFSRSTRKRDAKTGRLNPLRSVLMKVIKLRALTSHFDEEYLITNFFRVIYGPL